MAGLGLVVTFTGYLLFSYGYYMVRGSTVSISDLALPSHRSAALGKIKGA